MYKLLCFLFQPIVDIQCLHGKPTSSVRPKLHYGSAYFWSYSTGFAGSHCSHYTLLFFGFSCVMNNCRHAAIRDANKCIMSKTITSEPVCVITRHTPVYLGIKVIVCFQYCSGPSPGGSVNPATHSLGLLEPHVRRHWLMALLVILYKVIKFYCICCVKLCPTASVPFLYFPSILQLL